MIAGRKLGRERRPLVAILIITMAFLTSGCLWGIVKDAETGGSIPGATVRYTDAEGHTGSTTTDANGLYAFDIATGPVPAAGPVHFEVSAPGYQPLTGARLVEYNDNPNATLDNPSSFWEIQNFDLVPESGQWVEVELLSVDIDRTRLAPPVPISTDCIVGWRVCDPADPGGTLCSHEVYWFPISSTDPPPQSLSILCAVSGDTFQARVELGVRLRWQPVTHFGPPSEDRDISVAAFDWTAPALETLWQSATLDSMDAAGPDDPDLEFTAEIRYRSVLGPPPLP